MWQTVFETTYDDYKLSEEMKSHIGWCENMYLHNLEPCGDVHNPSAVMVPGTESQSASEMWECHRYLRMTASVSKESVSIWNILQNDITFGFRNRCFKYLKRNVWGLDKCTIYYMQRGMDLESKARDLYSNLNPSFVVTVTGFWVNKVHPQLGCSPDGLCYDSLNNNYGIIEIKCLKILKTYSVAEIIDLHATNSKDKAFKSNLL